DAIEGARDRVFRQNRDVLLAFVTIAQDAQGIAFDDVDVFAFFRFEDDAKQRMQIEYGLLRRDRDDRELVDVDAEKFALLLQHANDAKTAIADAHQLANRRLRAEQLVANLRAENANRRRASRVHRRQKLTLRH